MFWTNYLRGRLMCCEVLSWLCKCKIKKMSNFLTDTNVVGIVIGLMISSQAVQLVNEFVQSFVSPLISFMFNKASLDVTEIKLDIAGVQFKLASFLSALIRFFIVVLIVYLIYRTNSKLIVKK